ncbi:F-box and associated interaction domains-containing protein [Theobroma cacao]|uniref:F-box and associated interaction domains-containing protein n=1 Tax=Theobroma cacao TaxID=3641 RepID=A0A061FT71_THECC|nr:F-box and associated interaction domains-containing protein [Theobroma cacao]
MSMPITDKELPETLVMEILLRLPVKSLMRFKCVCKSWCSSFQTSYFITNHKNDNLNLLFKGFFGGFKVPHFSLLSTETESKKHGGPNVEFNLQIKENIRMPVPICSGNRSRLTVSGVCNGLLCLHDGYRITLWNPSTREVKLLPESTISLPPFVDCTYFYCMGLGFDRKSDDYKVLVNVINHVHDEERIIPLKYISQIHLYSLGTESWREIPHPKVSFDRLKHLFNIYINGFCHYINGICHWPAFDDSASFNEALATIVHPKSGMEKCYDIWVLNGYLWTKQLTIGPILGVGRPLGFWKNGELFLESENHDLVMFDPCTGKLQDFGIHMPKCGTQLVVYAESIVPIKGSSEYKANITRGVKFPVNVCKTWCSSFWTSYFITYHKNNNLNLLIWYVDKVPRYSLFSTETKIKKHGGPDEFNLKVKENIHIPVRQTVMGLCNGLLCLHDSYRITLWNPSMREVKFLPKSTISSPPSTSHTSFYCIGFGFDRKLDDYKILVYVFHYVESKIIFQIHLYSLNTDFCREIPHPNVYIYAPELFSTYQVSLAIP